MRVGFEKHFTQTEISENHMVTGYIRFLENNLAEMQILPFFVQIEAKFEYHAGAIQVTA